MSPTWHQAKQLFQEAIEHPEELQTAYVRQHASSSDQEQLVLRLLRQHHGDDHVLESPLAIPIDHNHQVSRIRDLISGYTILDVIGHGGMGTVYLAEQHHPKRLVAIKVMRGDFLSKTHRQRFENEIESLARLQHPGIARIYQSGTATLETTASPWFAMEFVAGPTLKEYLETVAGGEKELSLAGKIVLLQQLIRAVAYAHQQGIVHRDLKPANVLVQTADCCEGTSELVVKVVDFGIAKLLEKDSRAQLTMTQDVLGTLNYMSPEAIASDQEHVDHRVDIYALGVIAFELLSGVLPHDRSLTSFAKTVKSIEHDVPPRIRDVNPATPRDLGLIVEKAMATESRIRYETADDFLIDLQRFLDGLPVHARRPSLFYRTGRYLRRNRVIVTATFLVIFALLGGLIASMHNARQARLAAAASKYEAEKANAVNSFFTNDLLGQLLHRGLNEQSAETIMLTVDELANHADSMYADQPLILAAIRNELGTIYYNIQAFEKANGQYAEARELWKRHLGMRHPDTLKALSNQGQAQMALGAREETESLLREAYCLRREVLGETNEATLRSLNNLGDFLRRQDRADEAEGLLREGLEVQRQVLGSGHKTTLTTAANLGSLFLRQGRTEEALSLHQESFQAAKRTLGKHHALTLQTGVRMVQTLDHLGQYEQAEKELLTLIGIYRELRTQDGSLIIPYRLLARIHRHQREYERARSWLLEAKEIASRLDDRRNLARIERDLRRVDSEESEAEL